DVSTLTTLTDAYHGVAHDFALAASHGTASLDAFGACDVVASGEPTCAARFVAAFVPRPFRPQLEPDDASSFADVFAERRGPGAALTYTDTGHFYSRQFRGGAVASGEVTSAAGVEETPRFVEDVVWIDGGDLATLIGESFSFVNANLAET